DHFTYNAASAPAVINLDVSSGSTGGGTVVTITGTDFGGTTSVRFGSVEAAFTVASGTSIVAVAPAQAAATIDVTVTTPSGTSATSSSEAFTCGAVAAPTVSAVSPAGGDTGGGTLVTITGTNLDTTRGVSFDGITAAFTVVNSTTLFAFAPAHAAGVVDVIVE